MTLGSDENNDVRKKLVREILGELTLHKGVRLLHSNDIYDCSLQDVADATELSRNTVRKIIKEMLELKIIKPTRNVGSAKMFQINKENEYVRHLIKLDLSLSTQYSVTLERKVEAIPEKRYHSPF